MNKKSAIAIIIAIIVVIAIIIIVASSGQGTTSAPVDQQTSSVQTAVVTAPDSGTPAASTAHTVTYSNSGFSPATLTVKAGDTVTFVNQSSNRMWVASDPHPAHSGYSGTTRTQHCPDTAGTAFDQCSAGNSYTFTFAKTGSWGYHNHAVDEDAGTIIVQ
jgi:plastocyanin